MPLRAYVPFDSLSKYLLLRLPLLTFGAQKKIKCVFGRKVDRATSGVAEPRTFCGRWLALCFPLAHPSAFSKMCVSGEQSTLIESSHTSS